MTASHLRHVALALGLAVVGACNVVVTLDDLSAGTSGGGTTSSSGSTTSSSAGGAGGEGGAGSDGTGGTLEIAECEETADCPDTGSRCIEASCDDGQCVYEAATNNVPIGSQALGDCKSVVCSEGSELTINIVDPFDDGNACTVDTCSNGTAVNDPAAAREPCTIETVSGLCNGSGGCVECVDGDDCDDAASPICQAGACVPLSCQNLAQDGGETDVDCGGNTACQRCAEGAACAQASDCVEKVCDGDVCQPPTCSDGVLNQDETGTDCGGSCDATCEDGTGCADPTDCDSGVCNLGFCATPTCSDGVRNGLETDKDCGGGGCPECLEGYGCKFGSDCVSNTCESGRCVSTCDNGETDAGETDIDCGGPVCTACPDLRRCGCNTDCASNVCCPIQEATGPKVCAKAATDCKGAMTICQ